MTAIGCGVDNSTNPLETPKVKNIHAVALGQLGGRVGGLARARSLTKERRVEIAKKASNTRWGRNV